jgi:hypothetical protein
MWQVVGVGIVFSLWKLKWERVGLTALLMRKWFLVLTHFFWD